MTYSPTATATATSAASGPWSRRSSAGCSSLDAILDGRRERARGHPPHRPARQGLVRRLQRLRQHPPRRARGRVRQRPAPAEGSGGGHHPVDDRGQRGEPRPAAPEQRTDRRTSTPRRARAVLDGAGAPAQEMPAAGRTSMRAAGSATPSDSSRSTRIAAPRADDVVRARPGRPAGAEVIPALAGAPDARAGCGCGQGSQAPAAGAAR